MGLSKQVLFITTAVFTILLAVLFIPITQLIKKGGLFKSDFPKPTQFQLNCKTINELSSQCDKFVIHEDSSTAVFLCGENVESSKKQSEKNTLPVVYNIKKNSVKSMKITNYNGKRLSFKNIKLQNTGKSSKPILFILNELESGNVIEKFEYIPKKQEIIWKNTIKNKLIKSSSDFVPISENELYIINMFSSKPRWANIIEASLSRSASNVVYCDEKSACKIVAKRINGASGIAISNDKKTVYVSSSFNGKILIYERKDLTNSLRMQYTHELDFIPGSLTTLSKANNEVYVIGYRSVFGFLRYLLSSNKTNNVNDNSTNKYKSPYVIGLIKSDSENQFYGVKYKWSTVVENEGIVEVNKKDLKSLVGISMIGEFKNKQSLVSSLDSTIKPMSCNKISSK